MQLEKAIGRLEKKLPEVEEEEEEAEKATAAEPTETRITMSLVVRVSASVSTRKIINFRYMTTQDIAAQSIYSFGDF